MIIFGIVTSNGAIAEGEDARSFRLFHPDIAPWGDSETQNGFIVEIIETAFQRAGVRYQVVFAPWKREQAAVQQGGYAFMAPLTRLDEREPFYQWVAPVNISYLQLVTTNLALANLPVNNLLEFPIAARMESPAEFNARQLGFRAITLVEDEDVGARLLHAGRVTLWMQRGLPANWAYQRTGGMVGDLYTVQRWTTPQQYLVASPDVPLPVVEKLRTVLEEMRLSGEIDKIKQSFFNEPIACELLFSCRPKQ
ncbi:substrate-binding periplasmic protein [Kordiimonas aestuarii]|uniref:substrate-binding periplasmic protein n=1 Tax=Kordiimonas aestuarii TaxID=1005925 RepID=UPI0021D13F7D|nr:transporter substrate-binding domain-containing protein [Kordiimonas aestuarii]